MFDELVKQAEEKGIKGTEEQRQVARREANTLLKAYIARDLFDDEGFYPIYAPMDEVLQRALEELKTKNLTNGEVFCFYCLSSIKARCKISSIGA